MSHHMKSALALMFAFVFTSVASFAQSTKPGFRPGLRGTLEKLPPAPVAAGTKAGACGEYFYFAGEGNKGGVLTFIFVRMEDGQKIPTFPMVGSDKVTVRVIKDLAVPEAKVLRAGGPPPWIEISISPEELKRSSCLQYSMAGNKAH